MDTRKELTDAQFEEEASYVDEGWWLTGEGFVHTQSVMSVEGWNYYGSEGFNSLTHAQQTLMMWSDIVGQVSNGGFTQLCDNYERDLKRIIACVVELEWPSLKAHFDAAMIEQAGSLADPKLVRPVSLDANPDQWAATKEHYATTLARAQKPVWRPLLAKDIEKAKGALERLPNWQVIHMYIQAVREGNIPSNGEPYFDFVWPPNDAAEAFDGWFYSQECKEESRVFVRDFIVTNRDGLCRTP